MEYYYDEFNDFYVIKLNGNYNQHEYLKITKDILANDKRDGLNVYYTTMTNDYKYIILDFRKRNLTDDEIKEMINNKKRGK